MSFDVFFEPERPEQGLLQPSSPVSFEVSFAPVHRDEGRLRPRSANELAAVVERMQALQNFDLTFALITSGNAARRGTGLYAVAVNPDEDHGSIMFADPVRGNLYSKGSATPPPCGCDREDFPHIGYSNFGVHTVFPADSQVPVEDIEAALRLLYHDPASPPANLDWSEWEKG